MGELKVADGSPKSSPKTEVALLEQIRQDASLTSKTLAAALGISKRAVLKHIDKLKKKGKLRRIGPAKGGHWEIID
jgi:ATP-dependent DNA helicase RecG